MECKNMTTALWWIRRDLRLSDNQALASAVADADRVLPVYILDEQVLAGRARNEKRLAFLFSGLRELDNDLRARGSRLIVRSGQPQIELAALSREARAMAIFAEASYSPEERRQDAELVSNLPLHLTDGRAIHVPDAVLQRDGGPFTAFTPFSKAWKALAAPKVRDVLPPPSQLSSPLDIEGLPVPHSPSLPALVDFQPGEAEGQRRLRAFVDWVDGAEAGQLAPVYLYDQVRNRVDLNATSQLSPYLNLGMVSVRQAVVSALSAIDAAPNSEARYSAELWLDSLIRRDFATSIGYHYPNALSQGFRPEYRNAPWDNDQIAFDAWCRGRTGYPLVDAAMRQLVQTGWLHNRARQVVASFLAKDLLIDWRWGEQFFLDHLLDADLVANSAGWQRAAGTGTGAAPYLGILNPVLQGRKYDPEGLYVRRWLPELAGVPAGYIHEPWSMPEVLQRSSGCMIGLDYPAPILDHGLARDRAIEFFDRVREPAKPYRW
jgi:deoxyribodipyrimidine photo-lyase